MYIAVPVLILAVIIIFALWDKLRKARKALGDIYSVLTLADKATGLLWRLNAVAKVYAVIEDKEPRAKLRRSHKLLREFLNDNHEFAVRYDIQPQLYDFEFGEGVNYLDKLAFLAATDIKTIERRLKHIRQTGYSIEKLRAGYEPPSQPTRAVGSRPGGR